MSQERNDDMLTRRMNSGRREDQPSDPDATVEFSPLDEEQAAAPRESGGHVAEKPAMFSDEEWALISGTPAPGGEADAPQAAAGGSKGDSDTREVVVPDESRGPGVIGIIGTIWIMLTVPFVLAAIAVRAIASPLFLRFEYFWRPGFPADEYGFTADDRQHYGSYVVDYLHNFDGGRYLSDVVTPDGAPLFLSSEVAHMQDVKALVSLLYLVAIVMAIVAIVFMLLMTRRRRGALRPGLLLGGAFTLLLFAALAVVAVIDWERFFGGFHRLFFPGGNWEFYMDDSLIRLFPPAFWVDAGIGAAAIVAILAIALIVTSIPRRARSRNS